MHIKRSRSVESIFWGWQNHDEQSKPGWHRQTNWRTPMCLPAAPVHVWLSLQQRDYACVYTTLIFSGIGCQRSATQVHHTSKAPD